jgi:hypothetical protein
MVSSIGSAHDASQVSGDLRNLADEFDKDADDGNDLTCRYIGMLWKLVQDPKLLLEILDPNSNMYVQSMEEQGRLAIEAMKMAKQRDLLQKFIDQVPPLIYRRMNHYHFKYILNNVCDPEDRRLLLVQISHFGDVPWSSTMICEIADALACDVPLSEITASFSQQMWDRIMPLHLRWLITGRCVGYQDDMFVVVNQALQNKCLCREGDRQTLGLIMETVVTDIKEVPIEFWRYMPQYKMKEAIIQDVTSKEADDDAWRKAKRLPWNRRPYKHVRQDAWKEIMEENLSQPANMRLFSRGLEHDVFHRFEDEFVSSLMLHFLEKENWRPSFFPDELWCTDYPKLMLKKEDSFEENCDAVEVFLYVDKLGYINTEDEWVESFLRRQLITDHDPVAELFESRPHPSDFPWKVLQEYPKLCLDIWNTYTIDRIMPEEAQLQDDSPRIQHLYAKWQTPNKKEFKLWMKEIKVGSAVDYLLDTAKGLLKTHSLMQKIETLLNCGDVKITTRHDAIKQMAKDIISYKEDACAVDETSIWNV